MPTKRTSPQTVPLMVLVAQYMAMGASEPLRRVTLFAMYQVGLVGGLVMTRSVRFSIFS